jgi:glycosyltransferase involved in cell wall biosynthesis
LTDLSIIICTLNRAKSLAKTLVSVADAIQNVPAISVEVVLVNNGSTDDTQRIIEDWAELMPFTVKTIYEGSKGLAIARNTGITASEGAILAFTDDDCTLNSDYIIRLHEHYTTDTTPVVRGGRVELGDPTDQPFSILLGAMTVRMTDISFPGGFIMGANMTMKRAVIEKLGPFDTRFGAGAVFMAGEDTEYIYRAHRAGFLVEYVPDMIVKHFHGRKDKNSITSLSQGYDIADGALYAKYIRDRQLQKHFYWTCKNGLRGIIYGKNVHDEVFAKTHTALIISTLKGMLLYWYQGLCCRMTLYRRFRRCA